MPLEDSNFLQDTDLQWDHLQESVKDKTSMITAKLV